MNALVSNSGAVAFNPSLGEMVLEAFSRVQIRPTSLTADHWWQARSSANLLQSEWSNVGMPLLWKVGRIEIPLLPGVTSYRAPASIIAPLDAFIRQYQLNTPQNFAPIITGDEQHNIANIEQPQHGFAAGMMAYFATAIAASGQVIQGPQIVTTVVDQNNYQITLPTPLDGTNSVALPIFTATAGSTTVQVTLPNHGLSIGASFYCNVPVSIGGLNLSGQLVVVGVIDQDNFVVNVGSGASTSGAAIMNGGQAQVACQAPGVDPINFIMYPISRTEYVSQPDRGPNNQFRPTTFWFDRKISPTINFWNAPDDNGPYIFNLWAMMQPDDAVVQGGTGIDVPYRFLEPFAAGLAAKLARKYPPPPATGVTVADLKQEASDALQAALMEDIERVPTFISPGMWSYYR